MTDREILDSHKAMLMGDHKGPFFDPAQAKAEDIIFFMDKYGDFYIGTEKHLIGIAKQGFPSHPITREWLDTNTNWNHKLENQEITVRDREHARLKLAPEWWTRNVFFEKD